MKQSGDTELFAAYLLGELADDEAAELEAAFFADDALFEQVRAAETDLIDAYAAGALSTHRTKAFEARLLATDEQRERVAFARAMAARVAASAAPARAGWWDRARAWFGLRGFALAATTALAIVIGIQVVGIDDDRAPESTAITLRPTRLRSADTTPVIEVPRGAEVIQVALEIDDSARVDPHRVVLLDEGTDTRTSYEPTAAGPASVIVVIPAADLGTGRRTLALTDASGNDLAYYDVVVRRP